MARIGFTDDDRVELADRVISNSRLIELLHESTDRIYALELELSAAKRKLGDIGELFSVLSELKQ